MNIIIVYATKTAVSKKYAIKLSEIKQIKYYGIKEIKQNIIDVADKIIYIAPIRMNKMFKFEKFYDKFDLKTKKIIPICIGLTPRSDEYIKFIKEKNFKHLQNVDIVYYLRGAYDKNKLSFFDKCLINMIVNNLEKKDVLSQNEKMIYDMLSHNSDYIEYDMLEDIANSIE